MADKAMDNNQVTIVGTVDSEFTYSHEVFGEGFYMLEVVVNRLSHMEAQCSMAWALRKIEKEKPAAGKTDYWRGFWRSGWDSNPRNLAVQLISSQPRYDLFDTAPC